MLVSVVHIDGERDINGNWRRRRCNNNKNERTITATTIIIIIVHAIANWHIFVIKLLFKCAFSRMQTRTDTFFESNQLHLICVRNRNVLQVAVELEDTNIFFNWKMPCTCTLYTQTQKKKEQKKRLKKKPTTTNGTRVQVCAAAVASHEIVYNLTCD